MPFFKKTMIDALAIIAYIVAAYREQLLLSCM
jgi:hypothetical protein